MAQFIARIRGQRGEASRLGSKNSGMDATVNGWDAGVSILAHHVDGKDVFDIFETSGSNGRRPSRLIATIEDGVVTLAEMAKR